MRFSFNKKQVLSVVASVAVSVFAVTLMASAVTYISDTSVGIATDTPGVAAGVKGAGLFEGFVSAGYYTSTSTSASWLLGQLGLGTTTPGAKLSVLGYTNLAGPLTAGDHVKTSYLIATSTTATSTIGYGVTINNTTLVADASGNHVGVATSTFPQVVGTSDRVTLGIGAGTATSTVYIGGGATMGAQIIMRTNNGSDCFSIQARSTQFSADGTFALVGKLIECPSE